MGYRDKNFISIQCLVMEPNHLKVTWLEIEHPVLRKKHITKICLSKEKKNLMDYLCDK